MTPAVEQLVRETIELTGAPEPELMADDAPVLSDDALAGERGYYLVGIIGGKDVGKSALVNALVGRNITAITSHGPGTEIAVAYVHKSQEASLRELLEREVPGQYRIVAHDEAHLTQQVLLDLPDIDSRWESHPVVTRAMLRHMLFPIWVQSIEKYADLQPQQMLAKVAAGNSPKNFLFCLNKVDYLGRRADGSVGLPAEAEELRQDFQERITRTLSLDGAEPPPPVFLISAKFPDRYELPKLRQLIARQRSNESVQASRELAVRRQDGSLLQWLDRQDLPAKAARLDRLRQETEEALAARVAGPLLERTIPALLDDPANRLAMGDEILRDRVARWPLVNLVHTLLSPLLGVWRANVGAANRGVATGLRGAEALVEAYLDERERRTASLVQSTFAQVRQSQPALAELYRENRLWEDMPADLAAANLRRRLVETVERQRAFARERLAGRGGSAVAPFFRWLLTVGALLWFPFIQPVLAPFLQEQGWTFDVKRIAGLIVGILSGEALLKNATFLIIWFLVIWLALRWNTQRRLARLLARWKEHDPQDESLSLTAAAVRWVGELTDPITQAYERTQALAARAESLKKTVNEPQAA